MESNLKNVLSRVLRPVVRLMISNGVGIPVVSELLKELYVEQADRNFRIEGKRLTDSRISVLTGLRRREVKRLRSEPPADNAPIMGPVPRVVARWIGATGWQDEDGEPRVLPRRGEGAHTFEQLVAEVSRDIHPRTVLDALLAEGAIELDEATDTIHLQSRFFLPTDQRAQLEYLGANVGDHADAAVQNVLAGDDDAPFFERAAHFNNLSRESRAELDAFARSVHGDALKRVAERAIVAQEQDAGQPDATQRFRCGVFIFSEDTRTEDDQKDTAT